MHVIGNARDVDIISIKHKSTEIIFKAYAKPLPYCDRRNLKMSPASATFIFDDLKEIDELIIMLKRFRQECGDYIGSWRVSEESEG